MRWAIWVLLVSGVTACHRATPLDIPFPALGGLDPAVVDQLESAESTLRRAVASERSAAALAAAFGEAGETYHAYAFDSAADACYRHAAQLAPAEARWLHLRGLVLLRRGRPEAARKALLAARALAPDSLATRVVLADLAYRENDRQLAMSEYRAALRLDPECAPALLGLGRSILDDDPEGAIGHLTRALERQPGATRLHYPLGLAYRAQGNVAKAKEHFAQAGTVAPGCLDPWQASVDQRRGGDRLAQNRGTMLFRAGRYADARREFEAAVRANPRNGLAYAHLGSTLLKLGETPSALQALENAVRLAPDDVTVNYNMGTFLAQAGRDPEAIRFYQRALSADERSTQTRFNLANAYRRTRRWAESAEEFGRVIVEEPSNADARFARVLALTQLERGVEALAEAKIGVQVTRDSRLEQAVARLCAAAPDDSIRNGLVALEIATRLRERSKTLEHLEVEAMALAELRRFSEAADIQKRLIAVAREQGRDDLVRSLELNLSLYRSGRPTRRPWEREGLP